MLRAGLRVSAEQAPGWKARGALQLGKQWHLRCGAHTGVSGNGLQWLAQPKSLRIHCLSILPLRPPPTSGWAQPPVLRPVARWSTERQRGATSLIPFACVLLSGRHGCLWHLTGVWLLLVLIEPNSPIILNGEGSTMTLYLALLVLVVLQLFSIN